MKLPTDSKALSQSARTVRAMRSAITPRSTSSLSTSESEAQSVASGPLLKVPCWLLRPPRVTWLSMARSNDDLIALPFRRKTRSASFRTCRCALLVADKAKGPNCVASLSRVDDTVTLMRPTAACKTVSRRWSVTQTSNHCKVDEVRSTERSTRSPVIVGYRPLALRLSCFCKLSPILNDESCASPPTKRPTL